MQVPFNSKAPIHRDINVSFWTSMLVRQIYPVYMCSFNILQTCPDKINFTSYRSNEQSAA